MITIDALGKDGQPILADLEGASPTGGLVRTERRPGTSLVPGDVVREAGAWAVVSDVRHNGIHGITSLAVITASGETVRHLLLQSDGAEVRTDARIDPDTLWKLVRSTLEGATGLGAAHRAAGGLAPFGDLDSDGSAHLMDALGQTGPTTEDNHPRRVALLEAYRDALNACTCGTGRSELSHFADCPA